MAILKQDGMLTSISAIDSEIRRTVSRSVWARAAALGSLWAAFEIVVGSFLHNLRIPFAGTILAALGVVLMLAAAQVWRDSGLIWRMAVICALMKSISPSAVILGPMIGIFFEGLIVQAIVGLLGRGWWACVIAGAGAVSWALVQKVTSLLITYGPEFMKLYEGVVRYAARAMGWSRLEPAGLLWALLGVQCLIGTVAGLTGWWLGRSVSLSTEPGVVRRALAEPFFARPAGSSRKYSLPVLALLAVLLVAGMWFVSAVELQIGAPVVIVIVGLLLIHYRRDLGKLKRPRFWLELLGILMLSGLLLGGLKGQAEAPWLSGLLAGAVMAVRAVYVVVLFSAISVELRNPVVARWFEQGRFSEASAALRSAFESLPDFVASMPSLSVAARHPAKTLTTLFRQVDFWQTRHAQSEPGPRMIILTGDKGSGKTTLLERTAELLESRGCVVAGILSPGMWDDGIRDRYDVLDLLTGQRTLLARRSDKQGPHRLGPFLFDDAGLSFGRGALFNAASSRAPIVIVDEVGPLELRGGGWTEALDHLRRTWRGPMLWVVRQSLIESVRERWNLPDGQVLTPAELQAEDLAELLMSEADSAGESNMTSPAPSPSLRD
ncbi:MAG: nucleoside-triphosphatase [Bryobacteraceae bacterium]